MLSGAMTIYDDFPLVVVSMPANARQRRIALGGFVLMAAAVAITLPFANIKLARVDAFIPVIETVMCGADLLTAAFLFAQYAVQPQRALVALASGYVFSGLFAFLHTLAFPGAYGPGVLIGDELNSSAWLFVFWHTLFPLCKRRSKNPSLEAAEWLGCAGVKIRQPRSLCLIRVRARDERRGTLREGTTCGSN